NSPASRPRRKPRASACPSPDAYCCRCWSKTRPAWLSWGGGRRRRHKRRKRCCRFSTPWPDRGSSRPPPMESSLAVGRAWGGVVEQHSLCWLSGRLADDRNGQTWAEEFRRFPKLQQVTRDGGSGLAKGIALVNQQRQVAGQHAIADQEDHFHTLREGCRALRQ